MNIATRIHPGNHVGEEGFDFVVGALGVEFCDPDGATLREVAGGVDVGFEVGGVTGRVVPAERQ
jgi:hypothetical protein